MLAVLSELSGGPVSAREIETRTQGIPWWTAARRLHSLACNGFVSLANESGTLAHKTGRRAPPRARYALTELGREFLLEIPVAAARCEQTWCPPPSGWLDVPGLWALKIVKDPYTRAVVRALADGPLRSAELRARVPQLAHSTLMRQLKTLPEQGVLVREGHAGKVHYALADSVRHLAILPLRAAQCERRRATQTDRALRGDLPGLLHVLAPLVRIPPDVSGACGWHLDSKTTLEADIYLTAAAGKVAVLNAAPTTAPQALAHAIPTVWCEGLLHGDRAAVVTTGDDALFDAVFKGMSAALLA
ncbi:MAG TPA: winged helix-turn-helix transcriptional regulator [Solirubrobacteraceae bacterium]